MTPLEILIAIVELALGVWVGYDAERWDRDVNLWALAGAVLSVVGLGLWLAVRHAEAERRRGAGVALPPGMWRWLRSRHHPGRVA
jgi:hypothetical protein